MQQHRKLACHRNNGTFLGTLVVALGNLFSMTPDLPTLRS
jgi:hypothetical protein